MEGWGDRSYDLVLPDGYSGDAAVPVVVDFHGGGGNKRAEATSSCPEGDLDDAKCLHAFARRTGFALVYPNGTGGDGWKGNLRSWNAGGGNPDDEWRCTSVPACADGVDDERYVRELLDDLEGRVNVDVDRVYATGISNGGAMSHRMGCQVSDRFAAIAPVGGAMQWTVDSECAPGESVAVLHIHGTADTCWQYEGGAPDGACPNGQEGLAHVSVQRTLDEWSAILGCGASSEVAMEDAVSDGTTSTRVVFEDCALEHIRVDGGGHAWPQGNQYFKPETIGPVWQDWGNGVIWEFFEENAR